MHKVLTWLARGYPWAVNPSDELTRACRFLGWKMPAATVVQAGYTVGVVVGIGVLLIAGGLAPELTPLWAVVSVGAGIVGVHTIHRTPVILARLKRTAALGAAPGLIGRAVLRMQIEPSEEAAIAFAAETGSGPLAASLAGHLDQAAGKPGSGLDSFSKEWQSWFPALRRASNLLQAAGDAPPARRERTLDRALEAVLDGTRTRMQAFVSGVSGPVTGIYAFGVLLPLALVAVLPGARIAGIAITVPMIIGVYDIVLPVALLTATGWVLLQRPVAFPPPPVSRSHPDIPDRRWPALAAGITGAVGGGVIAWQLIDPWTGPIAVVGGGVGSGLVVWYRPVITVRDRVRAIERDLPDALFMIGRRVTDGRSVERGIEHAAETLNGPMKEILAETIHQQRVLMIGIKQALLGEYGALNTVPSPRTKGMATLLALAGDEGQPAGHAIVAMADHLEELQGVEQSLRQQLTQVTGTIRNTAAVFGPLVAGATVALADGLEALGATTAETGTTAALSVATLGTAIGVYVLILAVVLVVLATSIEYGFDRATIGYRVGGTVLAATVTFLVAYRGAGLLI